MVSAVRERSDRSVGSHRRGRPPERTAAQGRPVLLRVRDWRVRTKLAAVLVVPSIAFLVLAGLQVQAVAGRAGALDEFAGQVGLARQITALVHELQLERDRTIGELAALGTTAGTGQASARLTAVLQPIHRSVDSALGAFRRAARPLADGPAAWRAAYSAADEQLNQLGGLRDGVLGGGLRGTPVIAGYTSTLDALLDLLAQPSPGDGQPELSQPVLSYLELAKAKEINSQLRARLSAVTSAGRFAGSDVVELSDLRTQQLAALAQFRSAATVRQVDRYQQVLSGPAAQHAAQLEEQVTASAASDRVEVDPLNWWTQSTAEHNLVRQVEVELVDDAVRLAGARSAAQWRWAVLVVGLMLAVLLAAVAASVVIGRSMARALGELRSQALVVARTQLPELLERLRTTGPQEPVVPVAPPTVRSADEIGEVAEAFHAVHRSAARLAVEQALMRRNVNAIFVSLARRSQVLVERQLELLDRLEREESDPDQLASLFQLDHLAARMRRNDDNLLVLAGSESRRRWAEPVALSTVVLAAVAEIEQYPRIHHDVANQLYLVGPAVSDLVHLLAELLENATLFSPPDSAVLVTAEPTPDGRAAVLEVVDAGIGMSPQALDEANQTLSVPPPVDVVAAERMGLVVVSHLAARHGVQVRLHSGAPGLTARVRLPPQLLAAPPAEPVAAPASAGLADRPAAARAGRRGVPIRAEDVLGTGRPAPSGGTTWWSRPSDSGAAGSSTAGGNGATGSNGGSATEGGNGGATASGNGGTAGTAASSSDSPAGGNGTGPDGRNERGLPVRVPMAQLPVPEVERPAAPPRDEPDPEAVGGALSRLYGGVRQAQAEPAPVKVTVVPDAPAGPQAGAGDQIGERAGAQTEGEPP